MVYYYLNFETENTMSKKLLSYSFLYNKYLIKDNNDKKFYFFYNESEKDLSQLKTYLEKNNYNLIEIKINNKLHFKGCYTYNKFLFSWDSFYIYYGKINFNNKLEIIQKYNRKNNGIHFVNISKKYIIYDANTSFSFRETDDEEEEEKEEENIDKIINIIEMEEN